MPIGPFSVFGFVFNASRGMVPLVYLVGVAAMMFTAMSYMTMSRAFPIAGSVYSYAGRGIGESAGFLAGWALLLDYMLIPTLIYLGCAFAMSAIVPGVPKVIWVLVFVTVATAVNLFGITATARFNKRCWRCSSCCWRLSRRSARLVSLTASQAPICRSRPCGTRPR